MVFRVLLFPALGKASSISIGSWPAIALLFYDVLFVLFIIKSKKAIIYIINYKIKINIKRRTPVL
jgi:hypothetical protein